MAYKDNYISIVEFATLQEKGTLYEGFVVDLGYAFVITEEINPPNLRGFTNSGNYTPASNRFGLILTQCLDTSPEMVEMSQKRVLQKDEYKDNQPEQNASVQPDRNEYARIPKFGKAAYRDDGWKYVSNPVAFVNNVGGEVFNWVIDLVNGAVVAPQIMYHEGMGTWWDNEVAGMKAMWTGITSGVPNYFKGAYQYYSKTSAAKKWDDFKSDISNVENWERSTALGVTLFGGGYGAMSKAGTIGRSTGMLGEPSVTVLRGVNSTAGGAYNRALNGVVKPRGGLFGHSDALLHNSGLNGTVNSRLTSWTMNGDVAMNYALRKSGRGVILKKTIPVSKLIKSPNTKNVSLKHKRLQVSESEVLLKGTIRNAEVIQVK